MSDLPHFVYSERPSDGDLNTGEPWSASEERDIRYAIKRGHSVAKTAEFLCRMQKEVRDKAREMGLRFKV
jgi:hypothetical protein